jgi:hypothetical protein
MELIVGYLCVEDLVQSYPESVARDLTWWLFFLLFLALSISIPRMLLVRATSPYRSGPLIRRAWWPSLLSGLGFTVWVCAEGGPFTMLSWYQTWQGSLLLISFILLSSLYHPPLEELSG